MADDGYPKDWPKGVWPFEDPYVSFYVYGTLAYSAFWGLLGLVVWFFDLSAV